MVTSYLVHTHKRNERKRKEKKFSIEPRFVCVCSHVSSKKNTIRIYRTNEIVWPIPSMHKIAPKQPIPSQFDTGSKKFALSSINAFTCATNTRKYLLLLLPSTILFPAALSHSLARSLCSLSF